MNTAIPNILTMFRLCLIPLFLIMIISHNPQSRIFFLILFAIACITDFFDGYLARKYNISSTFGRVFDSISDKALIIIVCILILVKDPKIINIIVIPIILIILRELIVSGIREGLATQAKIIHVSKLGKYKATAQMVALGFLIIGGNENLFYDICQVIGIVLLYISTLLSIISGFYYLKSFYQHLKN